jgi:hypothetical protein
MTEQPDNVIDQSPDNVIDYDPDVSHPEMTHPDITIGAPGPAVHPHVSTLTVTAHTKITPEET